MQSLLGELIESIVQMPGRFVSIATSDPLSALLILIGGALIGVSVAVMGYLTLGAAVDLITPDVGSRGQPRADR
ncbi:hypothetical protein [Halomicrobium salinisoli]|uniref:hypothetical protein n=1 Tax=Halomicrobium salinisoli TaxID=2878391 RepID=UPI001CEFD24A|nr:hypothetical protein [Halomicrobium salinisoli]